MIAPGGNGESGLIALICAELQMSSAQEKSLSTHAVALHALALVERTEHAIDFQKLRLNLPMQRMKSVGFGRKCAKMLFARMEELAKKENAYVWMHLVAAHVM